MANAPNQAAQVKLEDPKALQMQLLATLPIRTTEKKPKRQKREANDNVATKCKHTNRQVYARGMCGPCYQSARLHGTFVAGTTRKNGAERTRVKQATKCGHTDRVHYAKDLCQQCYQKERRAAVADQKPKRKNPSTQAPQETNPENQFCENDQPEPRACIERGQIATQFCVAPKEPALHQAEQIVFTGPPTMPFIPGVVAFVHLEPQQQQLNDHDSGTLKPLPRPTPTHPPPAAMMLHHLAQHACVVAETLSSHSDGTQLNEQVCEHASKTDVLHKLGINQIEIAQTQSQVKLSTQTSQEPLAPKTQNEQQTDPKIPDSAPPIQTYPLLSYIHIPSSPCNAAASDTATSKVQMPTSPAALLKQPWLDPILPAQIEEFVPPTPPPVTTISSVTTPGSHPLMSPKWVLLAGAGHTQSFSSPIGSGPTAPFEVQEGPEDFIVTNAVVSGQDQWRWGGEQFEGFLA